MGTGKGPPRLLTAPAAVVAGAAAAVVAVVAVVAFVVFAAAAAAAAAVPAVAGAAAVTIGQLPGAGWGLRVWVGTVTERTVHIKTAQQGTAQHNTADSAHRGRQARIMKNQTQLAKQGRCDTNRESEATAEQRGAMERATIPDLRRQGPKCWSRRGTELRRAGGRVFGWGVSGSGCPALRWCRPPGACPCPCPWSSISTGPPAGPALPAPEWDPGPGARPPSEAGGAGAAETRTHRSPCTRDSPPAPSHALSLLTTGTPRAHHQGK